jgi:hypothetical protein
VHLSRVPVFFWRAALAPAAIVFLAFSVSGCVDTATQARVEPSAAPAKMARRDGVSPHGASVALTGVDGAPQDVADRFAQAFGQAAGSRDIATADAKKADYLVRGYLTAYSSEAGVTRLSYVFDVFDKGRRRVQRLTDDVGVRGASSDPWSLADETAMRALADRGAADLADTLTNTPEAVAASAIASNAGSTRSQAGETRVAQSGTSIAERTTASAPASRLGLAAAP